MTSTKSSTGRAQLQGAAEPIAALNRIHITEYALPWTERECLVDVREVCREIDLESHICPFVRLNVARMVNEAQSRLPSGYRLRLKSALRTLAMQKAGWDGYHKRLREEHPNWPLSALRRATNKYFAPYDQKAPPGHCTGGAVDVGLLNAAGEELDLRAPTTGWEAAYTWSLLPSEEARANRMVMVEAMLGAGFSNCRDEYWHYSYGDSAWAVRTGAPHCPYGWAHPPIEIAPTTDSGKGRFNAECLRDVNGRAISASAHVDPSADGVWTGELLWACGVEVRLTIGGALREKIYVAAGNEESVEVPDQSVGGGCYTITPASDRVTVSTAPIPPSHEK